MGTRDSTSPTKVDDGGARRDRTADLLHAMQALSQLSYNPTKRESQCKETPPNCQAIFDKSLTKQRLKI